MPASAGLPPACDTPEYLSLRVGGRDYGIDLRHVQAIQPYDEGLRLMGASPWLCGVKDRQDAFVPLLDLRALLPATAPNQTAAPRQGVVVIVELLQGRLGLLAEAVNDVFELTDLPQPDLGDPISNCKAQRLRGSRVMQLLDSRRLDDWRSCY
ncbi:chemotaxis protein CheW [Paucibacter sp. PLA-PC-4]|uniref:chemotaxis protein CheW n=1 Tax=Paucibacter sp. PLA-PC-4 TaxID=2993655 RepID=UPI002248FD2F|nr:chemotaxis protein CheW [Paucibacter sp. PLA-PC-4]MCX2860462.1 chemotaxis protein CheW [Paucibacter sp. PLA-PC-4]